MKEIYIVLTYTGTIPSKIIKYYTKHTYSHVSISLDRGLNKMYSFARLKQYNFLVGGLIKEEIDKGTFKRFKNTITQVYSMKVTEEQYEKINKIIEIMYSKKEKYKFNMIGAILISLNRKYEKEDRFYCAEFVKYILGEAGVNIEMVPELTRPEDFRKLNNLGLIYEGLLREYNLEQTKPEKAIHANCS